SVERLPGRRQAALKHSSGLKAPPRSIIQPPKRLTRTTDWFRYARALKQPPWHPCLERTKHAADQGPPLPPGFSIASNEAFRAAGYPAMIFHIRPAVEPWTAHLKRSGWWLRPCAPEQ